MIKFNSWKLTNRVTRIQDPLGVFMYLVEGDNEAILIDTGYGIGDLKSYVESLTDKKITVLLTHGHVDHANGCAPFETVYMSNKDLEVYKMHSSKEYIDSFKKGSGYEDQPNPAVRTKPFKDLHDQDTFDLGGISVEAVSVPGHTPGMMMMLIPEEKMMLFGDGCGPGTIILEDWSSNISDYKKSLEHVKEYQGRYNRIIRNHGTGESGLDLLENVYSLCDKILNKTDDREEVKSLGLPNPNNYKIYNAVKKDAKGNRVDGKEGNITYRQDKAV